LGDMKSGIGQKAPASGCGAAIDGLPGAALNPAAVKELAGLCKALAHPVRIGIVQHLMTLKDCECGAIVGKFDLAQSTISQHLKVLKESGLVQGQVEGTRVCYCLNPPVMNRFRQIINSLLDT
jgi:ArsR family transcriptional regulator